MLVLCSQQLCDKGADQKYPVAFLETKARLNAAKITVVSTGLCTEVKMTYISC